MVFDNLDDEFRSASWAYSFEDGKSLWRHPDFGRFPLYHGFVTSYLMMPFYYVFGASLTLLKLWSVGGAVFTLLLMYAFMRKAFGVLPAALALLLTSLHPSFIYGVKDGNFLVSYMLVFSMGTMYLLNQWWDTKKAGYYCAAMFPMAVGLGTRLWFVMFIGGLCFSAILLQGRVWKRFSWTGPAPVFRLFLKGLLCVSPIILWAVVTEYRDSSLVVMLTRTKLGLDRPLGVWEQLSEGPLSLLSGQQFFHRLFMSGHSVTPHRLYAWFVGAGVVWLLIRTAWNWRRPKELWVVSVFMGMILFSLAAWKNLSHHYFAVYPFPQMVLALCFWDVYALLGKRIPGSVAVAVMMTVILRGEVRVARRYDAEFKTVGACRTATDRMGDLKVALRKEIATGTVDRICCGIDTRNNLVLADWTWNRLIDQYSNHLVPALLDRYPKQNVLFVRYVPGESYFSSGHIKIAEQEAVARKRTLRLIHQFFDCDGSPIYEIYRYERRG